MQYKYIRSSGICKIFLFFIFFARRNEKTKRESLRMEGNERKEALTQKVIARFVKAKKKRKQNEKIKVGKFV